MEYIEIILITAGVLLLMLAAYFGKRQKAEAAPPKQPIPGLSADSAAKLQTSLTELVNELYTLSQDVTSDLDQKLSELKELVQLADTKLAEASRTDTDTQFVDRPSEERRTDMEASTRSPDPELQITVENENAPPPPINRYQQIYKMADDGLPIADIARRVQMGKGEIQLILSLRKKD